MYRKAATAELKETLHGDRNMVAHEPVHKIMRGTMALPTAEQRWYCVCNRKSD